MLSFCGLISALLVVSIMWQREHLSIFSRCFLRHTAPKILGITQISSHTIGKTMEYYPSELINVESVVIHKEYAEDVEGSQLIIPEF